MRGRIVVELPTETFYGHSAVQLLHEEKYAETCTRFSATSTGIMLQKPQLLKIIIHCT